MKDNGCGQTVQLCLPGPLRIGGETKLASLSLTELANQSQNESDCLPDQVDDSPRLYSAEEFFSAAHGLDSGRALSSESVSGWVQLAIAVGEEILDNHEAGRSNIEGDFESMFMYGVVEDSNTELQMYYKNETTFTIRSREAENKFQTIKSTGERVSDGLPSLRTTRGPPAIPSVSRTRSRREALFTESRMSLRVCADAFLCSTITSLRSET